MTLRVVETYVSYQGEGPNTTKPTVFVRFAGCNFKCPGWPCDTQHAIDPALFTKTQQHYTPIELADHVLSFNTDSICLTGGEVFLQNKKDLAQFITGLKGSRETIEVECFTNGSLDWGDDLPYMIDTFILDWKLPGSGENYETTYNTFDVNKAFLEAHDAIKFTIKDEDDYRIAKYRYVNHIKGREEEPVIYAGVVWNGPMSTEELCQRMLNDDLPWRLNVQVHKFVWHPDKIGV
jgi:7-carboxy-7-deazaguanine synthase